MVKPDTFLDSASLNPALWLGGSKGILTPTGIHPGPDSYGTGAESGIKMPMCGVRRDAHPEFG